MVLLRALAFVLLALSTQVPTVAADALNAPAAAEDAALQARTLGEAYNVLLDNYVHPLDTAALLNAGWSELATEAKDKAAAPGPAPALTGDRPGDLEKMRAALAAYLRKPNANPDGFIAAHALVRGMVHFVDEGHTYFLDQQQYKEYQSLSRGDYTYVGIGISVSTRGDEPRIVEVYDDTPARQPVCNLATCWSVSTANRSAA